MYITLLAEMSAGAAIGLVVLGLVIGAAVSLVLSRVLGIQTVNVAQERSRAGPPAGPQRGQDPPEADRAGRPQRPGQAPRAVRERDHRYPKRAEGGPNARLVKREDNLDRKLDVLATKEKFLDDQEEKIKKAEGRIEGEGRTPQGAGQGPRSPDRERHQAAAGEAAVDRQAQRRRGPPRGHRHRRARGPARGRPSSSSARWTRANEEIKNHAQKITLQAIQRYASEHTANGTVSAIPIPSDDLKGRVIGREGRNIRAFEKATGVDVIVDDTPGVVVVSCFDPVRRAVAAESMQRLVDDGRIPPHADRGDRRAGPEGRQRADRQVRQGRRHRGQHPGAARAHQRDDGPAALPDQLRAEHPPPLDRGGVPLPSHRRRAWAGRGGRPAVRVPARRRQGDGPRRRRRGTPRSAWTSARSSTRAKRCSTPSGGHHSDIPATTPYTAIVMAARRDQRRPPREPGAKPLRSTSNASNSSKRSPTR